MIWLLPQLEKPSEKQFGVYQAVILTNLFC
jgi:hypothetical protein